MLVFTHVSWEYLESHSWSISRGFFDSFAARKEPLILPIKSKRVVYLITRPQHFMQCGCILFSLYYLNILNIFTCPLEHKFETFFFGSHQMRIHLARSKHTNLIAHLRKCHKKLVWEYLNGIYYVNTFIYFYSKLLGG